MAALDPAVEDLDDELRDTLGLYPARDVPDWLDPQRDQAYLVNPSVRIAHHFDLTPAFLIRDSLLGTLGIVNLVEGTPAVAAGHVRKCVDSATYVRHLLVRDPHRRNAPAHTVELVLLARNDPNVIEGIGAALRELLRTTDSLFDVGISLLLHKAGSDYPFGRSLRRGFPWLLTATRHWMESDLSRPPKAKADAESAPGQVPSSPVAAKAPPERLDAIKLSNYRLPGSREFKLARARVHLVHGANGSGKSTLVEALELLSSAKVDRLDRAGEEDYARVIKNRASLEGPIIETRRGNKTERWDVVKRGLKPEPVDPVHASSFRLDQALMDLLVGNRPHERALHYLRAFSPTSSPAADQYVAVTGKRDDGLKKIQAAVDTLKLARKGVEDVEDWLRNDQVQATTESFPDLLNRWLERTALVDLARREHAVRATLRAATVENHWTPRDSISLLGNSAPDPDALAEVMRRWAGEAEQLLGKLKDRTATSEASGSGQLSPRTITRDRCDALNRVSYWLFESDVISAHGAFGDKLVKVLGGDDTTYDSIVIGQAKGWATPVLSAIDALTKSCQDLLLGKGPFTWSGKDWPDFKEAADLEDTFVKVTNTLSEGFLALLKAGGAEDKEFDKSLIAAVNELMALFTPARWSYEDIQLPPSLGNGQIAVSMELGSTGNTARADLHLNTAELNLFTIALFLLCAGRVPKPLGLLVLDDPLQNMDELTSTALARGLAKVIRLWQAKGRTEELLLLFHGNEDLERFQQELSGAVYRLPWLSPSQVQGDLPPIEAERMAAREATPQSLDKLIEPTPLPGDAPPVA